MEKLRSSFEAPGVPKEQADVISVRDNSDGGPAGKWKATYLLGAGRQMSKQRNQRVQAEDTQKG